LLERRELSSAELFAAYRDAIAARDGDLHCFLTTVDEPKGAGVPIALKDVIGTQDVRTTAGSRFLERYVPVFDSTVAARCKGAGLPLLGKTNMDEFAMGSSTENSAYGPTRNPWDPERVPGGSSGGSAAAVAAGLAPWALGSDTGGSIKQPAALTGTVGLRPTYGTVSRYGIVAFASSLDQVGPLTKTVRDCALLYRTIAGRDPADTTTVDLPAPVEIPAAGDLRGLRVGIPRELNEAEGIEPGVKAAVEAAHHARHLRALGRLLRGLLRPGPEGADPHRPRVRRRLRALRRARLADLADRRLPARRADGEPDRHVPLGRVDDPAEHGRTAGALDSVRPLRGPPRWPAAHRPAVLREHALPRRPRPRDGARLRPG